MPGYPTEGRTVEVEDAQGASQPPANATEQQATQSAVQEVQNRQGNWPNLYTDSVSDGGSGTQFAAKTVPDGTTVAVQADPGNSAEILVGPSGSETYPLQSGGAVSLAVTDTSAISVKSSDGTTQTANLIVEVN